MIILLLDELRDDVLAQLQGENVLYRPDLLQGDLRVLPEVLAATGADALVANTEIAAEVLEAWTRTRTPTYTVRVLVEEGSPSSEITVSGPDASQQHHIALCVRDPDAGTAYVAAFEMLEREIARNAFSMRTVTKEVLALRRDRTVVLVGAGLVNLITACALQKAGYALRIVDAGPDPRDEAPWLLYGCSRGGGDARMFSLSEMNNYHDKRGVRTLNQQFRRSVQERGWAVYRENTLSKDEWQWIEDFEKLPIWLAHRYTEDIFGFNRESYHLWTQWQESDPELFSASYYCDGIVRLFDSPSTFEAKTAVQQRLGAVRRVLSAEQIAAEHPALADAVNEGYIAGGVDEVGFTIMAHEFMRALLDDLARNGAEFDWNTEVKQVLFDRRGHVAGVQADGLTLEAHDYVVSPGAYGRAVLDHTRSRGQIHGVLGVWLTLPNADPQLSHSLKLRRTGHIVDAANITLARGVGGAPLLVLGSGYGYTGVDVTNIEPSLLEAMYQGLVDTAQKYFRHSYELAASSGDITQTFKYCVRPWTPTSLGVFEQVATRGGGKYVVTGGHNTGGFAQAPAVAQAVLAALDGQEHPMHYLYHPDRATVFLRPEGGVRHQSSDDARR